MRVELILEVIGRNLGLIDKVRDAVEKTDKAAPKGREGWRRPSDFVPPQPPPAMPPQSPPIQQPKSSAPMTEAVAGVTGAVATAASIAAPIAKAVKSWNAYEDVLGDIGIKADVSRQKLAELEQTFRAQEKAVNTGRLDLAKGFDQLMAGGLDFDKSAELAAPLAKVTRATKSEIEDVSKSTVALVNNMKVLPSEVQRAFDVMNQAGKDGQFEMKDMAKNFPKVGAGYATMGQTGIKAVADLAAMLQVMRMNVSTAGEAVTNLDDLLRKFTKGPAIKGFESLGMDGDVIKKRMEQAQKAGRIMEEMQAIMQEATKGDLSKLNDIFSDKQAQDGAKALMQHWEKYLEIRKKALEQGAGSIDRDFATRMQLGVEKAQALTVAMEGLWTTLGKALAPMMAEKIDQIITIVNAIERWIAANPELAATLAKVATTVAALMVGVAALKLVLAALRLGGVVTAFRLLGVAIKLALMPIATLGRFLFGLGQGIAAGVAAVGGWRVVLTALGSRVLALVMGPLALLRTAIIGIGTALMATPVGWIAAGLAAVAAAAYLIYNNWSRIGPMLSALWARVKAAAVATWNGLVEWFASLGSRIADAVKTGWSHVTEWFSALEWPKLPPFPALDDLFAPLIAGMTSAWKAISDLFETFKPLDAIVKALDPIVKWIEDWGGKILAAFGGIFEKIGGFVSGAIDKIGAGFTMVGDVVSAIGDKLTFGPKLIEPAKIEAGIKAAKEYETQIKAIAPAAQEAVRQANATLAAANFKSHGIRMMETLAEGIRAGSNAAVNAVRDTVQKMRDHLPHSPAKTGPLSDLDRVKFSETLATAIDRGSPRALAAARTLAAGLAATLPSGAPAFASVPAHAASGKTTAGVRGGGDVTVNLTLSPNFKGGTSEDFVTQLRSALPDVAYELGQTIRSEQTRRDRTKF